MFKLVPWTEDLDLTEFYSDCLERGYLNNINQKVMIDCLRNERRWAAWILYRGDKAVGSCAAHSFDDVMGPDSYRVAVRTCAFIEANPHGNNMTIAGMMRFKEHQHVTAQWYMTQGAEWSGSDNLYITSNESPVASQRKVNKYYLPLLEELNVVTRVKQVVYRGLPQTVWKLHIHELQRQFKLYQPWPDIIIKHNNA